MQTDSIRSVRLAALCAVLWACLPAARAEVFELFPTGMTSDCNEALENVWNNAAPGDEIVLNAGVYAQGCRRFIDNSGTAAAPIVLRAADGADVLITRPEATSNQNNNIEIRGSHLVIRGVRFQYGSAGVSFLGGSSHITFEDNEVFDTYDNALRLNSGDTDSFVIRNNHIHHTGLGGATGEGMYIGCHSGTCVASNHLIENNYIHDLESQSGGGNDGIEIKYRSYGNVVRGNLIHDTIVGQDFPCIFVYGHGAGARNVVENNFVYNCGEAILVTADVIVRNNVVLSSTVNGIHINRQQPAPAIQNVTVVNNTVYGSHPTCARLNTGSGSNVVVANNAFYCAASTAVSGNLGSTTLIDNYVAGAMASGSIDNARFFDGGSAANAFVDPANDDFHLSAASILIDAGDGTVPDLPASDYDGNARIAGAAVDVGAFESGSGGGPADPPPTLDLSVAPQTIEQGQSAQLTWSTTDADACEGVAGVSGQFGASGTQAVAPTATTDYTLRCSGPGGQVSATVTLTVTPASPDSDGDGLMDDWERRHFGNLDQTAAGDPDADGFDNGAEQAADTDPNDARFTPDDTDGDGMPDAAEIAHFGNLDRDGTGDADGDGVSDADEIAAGTDPNAAPPPPPAPPAPPAPPSGGGGSGGGAASLPILLGLLLLARRRCGRARAQRRAQAS